jgi:hypothetical protein
LGICLSKYATNFSLCLHSFKCTISCGTTYSMYSFGFLANSKFNQILAAFSLQVPHFVVIRLIPKAFTWTLSKSSHFSIKVAEIAFKWGLWKSSNSFCWLTRLVAGLINILYFELAFQYLITNPNSFPSLLWYAFISFSILIIFVVL